uniref:Alternative protein FBXO17 n=1 Tax=Homo sapiens TaxID=9606 RepID=L8E8U1_HUMAN|nr:alternative protein FBXO17 [Homo sapiens]
MFVMAMTPTLKVVGLLERGRGTPGPPRAENRLKGFLNHKP